MAGDSGIKAQPDVGTLTLELTPKADAKVALDIDDAPFLREEPEPLPATKSEMALQPSAAKGDEAARKKKKKLMIAGAVLLLLLAAGGAALWWFKLRTPPVPPPTVEPEIIKVPSASKAIKPAEFVVDFAPFWVELSDEKGGVVFLVCKFAAITGSETLMRETQNKMTTLRDAVYYYLKNKPYQFLLDPDNAVTIKQDLNSVLSGYLGGGKIDDMLFESYLGK